MSNILIVIKSSLKPIKNKMINTTQLIFVYKSFLMYLKLSKKNINVN